MKRISFLGWVAGLCLIAQSYAAEPATLRWGGDSEGGAPYVFQDPADPSRITGFEYDFVEALANQMGRKAEFVQNQWDGLIPGLQRGNYDLIVNGLEITDDRKEQVAFSIPYYVTFEQLTVRKEEYGIQTLKDLHGKVAGTLKYAVSERILQAEPAIKVNSYEGQINAYQDLEAGRLDAVLMDAPIALYYGTPNSKLKHVGQPIGRLEYGIAMKKSDGALLQEVNRGIRALLASGELRRIYQRWGLWDAMGSTVVADYFQDGSMEREQPVAFLSYLKALGLERTWQDKARQYVSYVPLLWEGALTTLQISLLAMALAVVFGLLITLVRLYAPTPFSALAVAYVEIVRGTPLILQLFFIFYGLPSVGIKLSPLMAAVLGLGFNYAAYEAENYRAGIQAIPKNQMDTALSLGMSRMQALFHIIIPQATRVIIPPVTNDFISLLKDSSLVSIITMVELTKVYGQLASTYYDYFGIGILAAILYFLIGMPFVQLSKWAERTLAVDRPQV